MKLLLSSRSFQITAIILAALLLLVVNREFGVADNGDFTRYMSPYASKPFELKANWPQQNSEEWGYRFFNQPLFYWSPPVDKPAKPWFTSASLFWKIGAKISDYLFSPQVFNLKYIGLPFFLIQFLALLYVLNRVRPSHLSATLVFLGAFFIMTDARITAFYNSFYAESVPTLAVLSIFAFFAVETFSNATISPLIRRVISLFVLLILLVAIFAKRQYLYFAAPALILVFYLLESELGINKKLKILSLTYASVALIAIMVGLTLSQRVGNPSEASAARITSYHALYYGILPQSRDPLPLMTKLGLPLDSKTLIGKNAWNDASQKLITKEKNINLKTFLKAAVIDPFSFVRSALNNAKEIGNFNIPLGMVYGTTQQYPPTLISSFSVASTAVAGIGFFSVAVLLSLTLIIFPYGATPQKRFSSRILSTILLIVIVCDVAISTFDGQQEARKHVLVASITAILIIIQGISTLAGRLKTARQTRQNM